MARDRFSSISTGFEQAIAALPDGNPVGRRRRAVARLLEAGLRPREIIGLKIGDPGLAATSLSRPSSMRAGGRKARVVRLDGAAAADLAAFLEDRRTGHRGVESSDIDHAVDVIAANVGARLRAHEFRRFAAVRVAEATTDEDRSRTHRGLEGPDTGVSP